MTSFAAISSITAAGQVRARALQVQRVTTWEALQDLLPVWDALLDRCAVRTPFMTWDWITAWWLAHQDQGHQLAVVVARDGINQTVAGIAPMMIGRPQDGPRRRLRHLTFIGCVGCDASQGMDFIVPRGMEADVMPLLCQALTRQRFGWDVLDLPTMHEESSTLPFIREALATFPGFGERSAPQLSYMMALPASWEEQLNKWRSKERVAFRTKWRRLMDEHGGRLLLGGVDVPAEQAFEELWRLHGLRFTDGSSCFLSEAMRQHQLRLLPKWIAEGRAMLPLIEADGKIVAARYGFVMDGKYWSYQTGYDPGCGKLSVGILSLGWTAQCAINRGLHELDHLPGEARYKSEWSTHTRTVLHLEAYNPLSVRGAIFRAGRAIKRHRDQAHKAASIEAPSSALKLEIIRDEAAFFALAPHWDALHQRSAVRTPFRTWDWTRLWWKHFGDRFELRIGVLRAADGSIAAIAPFVLGTETRGPRRRLKHLTYLAGMGEVSSEGLDFLVPQGQEAELLPEFADYFRQLRDEWQVLDLPFMHDYSPSLPVLKPLLEQLGGSAERFEPQTGHVLKLEKTWDEQLATFSRNRRGDIRSKWKKLLANHAGRPLVGGADLPAKDAMDALFKLHHGRFAAQDSTFITDRAEAFHRELVDQWLPQNRAMLSLLEADGKIVAARYGFIYDNRYWDYQSGFDEAYAPVSIGNLNLSWAVQNAIARGLAEYDHLCGDQGYKHAWSTHTRRYCHLEALNRRSASAQFFMLARGVKRLFARSEPAAAPSSESKPKPATE